MKKIILIAFTGIAALVLVSSCKSGPGNDPKATLAAFVKAISKKDFKQARQYVTKESRSLLDMMEQALALTTRFNTKQATGKALPFNEASVEMGDASINGDLATIPVTDKTTGETADIVLKKEDGDWKVDFDPSRMAEISGERANRGINKLRFDSIKNTLRMMTSDSAIERMQEGMKRADSLMKAFKK